MAAALAQWRRIVTSAPLMTWANLAVRALGLLALLPLVLAVSTPAEVVVWMLLTNAAVYVAIADFGCLPTFSRAVAQAPAGPHDLPSIIGTMRHVYVRVAAVTFVVMLAVGIAALVGPMVGLRSQTGAWIAAAAVLFGATVSVFGNQYVAFLTGMDQVATCQRTLAVTGLAGVLTGILLLLAAKDAFAAIVAQQAWTMVGVSRCAALATRINHGQRLSAIGRADAGTVAWIWPGIWRSGVSTLLTLGALQLGNFVVAQVPDRAASASYLLSQRILQAISQFAQAPFYSRIPVMNRLHAAGDDDAKQTVASSAMRQSHWVFALGFIAAGSVGQVALQMVGSSVDFASPLIWGTLGMAMMGERYGAMHLQLYSTTNHIVWHVAALRHGAAFLATGLVLWPFVGLFAVPVALLVAYWGLYVPYCTRLSYGAMGDSAAGFEASVLWPPLTLMLIYVTATLVFAHT